MHGEAGFSMLEAAYALSETRAATLHAITRAAGKLVSRGQLAVCTFDADALPDRATSCFARASDRWVSVFHEVSNLMPIDLRRRILSGAPEVVDTRGRSTAITFTPSLLELGKQMGMVAMMANTGRPDTLTVGFGGQTNSEWPDARIADYRPLAEHLAAAWRLRAALGDGAPPPVAAELRVDGEPAHIADTAAEPTAREALRRAVQERERLRTGKRSASGQPLWPALVAGRWTLVDAFTAGGTRYVVAYENPAGSEHLRALTARQRSVVEHALAGRSGKWIALALGVSGPTITRTIRSAQRRLGLPDLAVLAGLQDTVFESLDGVDAGGELAMAARTPELPAGLSAAERQIMAGILDGQPISAIARDRGTSPWTVAHQAASLYRKLGVSSRRELLAQS